MSSFYPSRRFHPLTPGDLFRNLNDFWEKGLMAETTGMRADLKETESAYILEAELPGFKKENISVEWQDGRLLVAAKKEEETKEEKENYIRRERTYGEVSRRFRVEGIKPEEITAEYKEGILKVNMPKTEPVAPENKTKINID